ncbi:MAG TPA: DUF6089 family protein [Puia sp.]|jgi:hypothetical protein|nr:DUF6089 family protein [Puia sp.]
MKKIFVIVLLIPFGLQAQFHLNLFGGFSNYSGDLQSKRFTLDQSYGAFGIGGQYDLTTHFSLLSGFNIGHVGAADKFNKADLQFRNLSFQTKIFEWNVMGEYNILDLNEHKFTPYVFAGLAIFHFNPFAYDTLGNKIYLRPLSTEGEGLPQYPGNKEYSLTQLAIPFGAGIKLRVTSNVTLSYEISFRKLFTDYLDDVSKRYVDEATLLSDKGPVAVEMAYRGNEIKNGAPYPAGGTLRGNSKYNDWYYFSGIRVSISFGDGYNGEGSERYGKSRLDCPKKVY